MPAPVAVVTVTIQEIDSLAASVLGTATAPYFLATVQGPGIGQGRRIGRSRLVSTSATTFDFTAEPQPWTFVCPVGDGDAISITLTLYDDLGDAAPNTLVTITGSVPAPWATGTTTLTGPNGESVLVNVTSIYPVPGGPNAAVPRVADGTQDQATLHVPDVVAITFEDILGLYKPTPGTSDRSVHVTPDPTASPPILPYASEDDLGRIFLNRDYQKNWVAQNHQIELHVSVTALWGEIPPGAKVLWTVVDPDDPTNDDPGFHAQWGPVVDPNDYDGSGVQTGACLGDNVGTRAGAAFTAVAGFDLSDASDTSAKTEIVNGESQVTFNGTNAAGDNFIIVVSLDGAGDATVLQAQTGIMTMWHQLNLEYGQMPNAFDLPVDGLPAFFEPVCVQLDVQAATSPVADQSPLAASEALYHDVCDAFVPANFQHNGQPGWFCVIAAKLPYPPSPKPTPPDGGNWPSGDTNLWWNGRGSDHSEWFDLPGNYPGMQSVDFVWTPDGATDQSKVTFEIDACWPWVNPDGTQLTRFFIRFPGSHGMTHDFAAKDGSVSNAYKNQRFYHPQGYVSEAGSFVADQGYKVPHVVNATVSKAALMVAGTSPSLDSSAGKCFGGRTIIYTQHPKFVVSDASGVPIPDPNDPTKLQPSQDYTDNVMRIMTHELGHAFGMPHICGYHDFHTPRDHTCTMNYPYNWMRDYKSHLLLANTDHKGSNDFCGLHLREIRKTDLTQNPGLSWT